MSTVYISRSGWLAITAVTLLPWAFLIWLTRSAPSPAAPPPAVAQGRPLSSLPKPEFELGQPGPWGQLQTTRILIEPPEDFIPAYFTSVQPLRWTFKGGTPASLEQLWTQAGLSPAQRDSLNDPALRAVDPSGVVLSPRPETVLGLAPEARGRIYSVLAQFPENVMQRDPFRSRLELVDEWFEENVLPPDIVALTRRLLYRREANMLFSDHDLVLPKLATSADRVAYIKLLSRKTSLLAELIVPHRADVDSLVRYWGHGRRSKDIGPILQSIAQRPAGGSIDIIHLLPPFARTLLYTFPVPTGRPSDAARDCHWTSLNFFLEQPDERFANLDFVQQTLLRDYYLVSGAPLMGDIVLLVDPSGQGVHSCVHVADHIVFTKNGVAFSVPWQLAQLENVVAFYSHNGPLDVRRYRAR